MALELVNRSDGRMIPLTDGTSLTIGRGGQSEIQLQDQSVSRRLCTLAVAGGEVRVTDLESANGTFMNERAIESVHLQPGDLLRVGSTVFGCRTAGAPMSLAARLPRCPDVGAELPSGGAGRCGGASGTGPVRREHVSHLLRRGRREIQQASK